MMMSKSKLLLGVAFASLAAFPIIAQESSYSSSLDGMTAPTYTASQSADGAYGGDDLGNHSATQHLNMNDFGIFNLRDIDPSNPRADQAANKRYIDGLISGINGDPTIVRTGNAQTISGNKTFTGVVSLGRSPTSGTHATSKSYVDGQVGGLSSTITNIDNRIDAVETDNTIMRTNVTQTVTAGKTFNGPVSIGSSNNLIVNGGLNMTSGKIFNLLAPTASTDAANKSYVDGAFSGDDGISISGSNPKRVSVDSTVVRTTGPQTLSGYKSFDNTILANGATSIEAAGTSKFNGQVNIQATLDMKGNRIIDVADPTGGGNAVNMSWVNGKFVAAGSTTSGAVDYNGTTPAGGRFYGGSDQPGGSTILNYQGYFRANRFYSTMYLYFSDRNLKKDIAAVEPETGMQIVRQLEPVSYKWRENDAFALGVIAQQVEEVIPSAVKTGEDGIKAVDYLQMISPMIAAIQELDARIAKLEAAQ